MKPAPKHPRVSQGRSALRLRSNSGGSAKLGHEASACCNLITRNRTQSVAKDRPPRRHKSNKLRCLNRKIKIPLTFSEMNRHNVKETMMPTLTKRTFSDKSQPVQNKSCAFDRAVAASVGRCITLRRTLCGLSQQQLGIRLGIDAAEVDAYEQGEQRITVRLLLDIARHLRAHPTLFFQGQVSS
jgi:ribosome-binding protein aMBF1 (putative translation factor)